MYDDNVSKEKVLCNAYKNLSLIYHKSWRNLTYIT